MRQVFEVKAQSIMVESGLFKRRYLIPRHDSVSLLHADSVSKGKTCALLLLNSHLYMAFAGYC